MLVDTEDLMSISEASKKGVSSLARSAQEGRDVVLLKNSEPVAAIVSMGRIEHMQNLEEAEEDLRLMALSLSRVVSDNGNRTSFDNVLAHFGLEEADLVSVDDDTE